jgi:hypothetical protein
MFQESFSGMDNSGSDDSDDSDDSHSDDGADANKVLSGDADYVNE